MPSQRTLSRAARRAYAAVRVAIRRGQLIRPGACQWCGLPGYVEAAHDSYAVEDRLNVRWLCRGCHRWRDYHFPKGAHDARWDADLVDQRPVKAWLTLTCAQCGVQFERTYHDSLRRTADPCCSRSCGMRYVRSMWPERYAGTSKPPLRRGESNGRARLTEPQVVAMRVIYADGGVTQAELAAAFGVTQVLVGLIVRGKAWAHAGGPLTERGRNAPRG